MIHFKVIFFHLTYISPLHRQHTGYGLSVSTSCTKLALKTQDPGNNALLYRIIFVPSLYIYIHFHFSTGLRHSLAFPSPTLFFFSSCPTCVDEEELDNLHETTATAAAAVAAAAASTVAATTEGTPSSAVGAVDDLLKASVDSDGDDDDADEESSAQGGKWSELMTQVLLLPLLPQPCCHKLLVLMRWVGSAFASTRH